jgi:hypothetical protein
LLWLPIDDKLLDAARGFAAASWEREDLDESWAATGWKVPACGSVAEALFEKHDPLVTPEDLATGWSGQPDETRADYDGVWRAAVDTATGRLGEPAVVGMHDEHWHHAIWRRGDALLALVQGEHLDTYGFWDEAALWLVPHPADAPMLSGRDLYAIMW